MFTLRSTNDATNSPRLEEFQLYLDKTATSDCMNDRIVPMLTANLVKQVDSEEIGYIFWNDANITKKEHEKRRPFGAYIMTQAHARCFFVTDTSELGLGPRHIPLH